MNPRKLLLRIGTHQNNVGFSDRVRLAQALGFIHDRTSGSHHILIHREYPEAQLNLQPDRANQAKAYQVRPLLKLVEAYNLTL